MSGRVVHCKKEPFDVYIGRGSKWGNPFTHLPSRHPQVIEQVASREEAIRRFEKWVVTRPELMASLHELHGKTLGCWCDPRPCHGHVLASLAARPSDAGDSRASRGHGEA